MLIVLVWPFDDLFKPVIDWFNAWYEYLTDPLWVWYFYGALFFAACCVIAFFLPFKWIRAILGGAIVLVGAYIAGGRHMHKKLKEEVNAERAKRKEAERVRNSSSNGGGGSGRGTWGWPFSAVALGFFLLLEMPAHAQQMRCYAGYCAPVVRGVLQIPRSALLGFSAAEITAAKLYARRNGIRWRVVRD